MAAAAAAAAKAEAKGAKAKKSKVAAVAPPPASIPVPPTVRVGDKIKAAKAQPVEKISILKVVLKTANKPVAKPAAAQTPKKASTPKKKKK